MSEKEYIVTLNKGVDYNAFNAEMIASTGAGDIPNRGVSVANARPLSPRNTHYSLTDAEASALRDDSRVTDVQLPTEDRDDIDLERNSIQSGNWIKSSATALTTDLNWGMLRGANETDSWGSGTSTVAGDFPYTLTGKGVDVVISDSGLQIAHPEFKKHNYVAPSLYNAEALIADSGIGAVFDKSLQVRGIKIVQAGAVGGNTAVADEFTRKVAKLVTWIVEPKGAGINQKAQENFIKILRGDAEASWHPGTQTVQRIGYGSGGDYDPNWLSDAGAAQYVGYTQWLNTVQVNDMVWYLNSSGDSTAVGDTDAQEVMEHIFHTMHMFGLDARGMKQYPYLDSDYKSGELYLAMKQAIDASKYDPSGYAPNWDSDEDQYQNAIKEYLYLLHFGMHQYSYLWPDKDSGGINGSLSPEWTDDMRTPTGIATYNPLGFALFAKYINPVMAKIPLGSIRSLFRDGDAGDPFDAGASQYIADSDSRIQTIDWYEQSGLTGSMNPNHDRDYDGHGTHCGGTVAGLLMGWAKDANIYSVKVAGLEGTGDSGGIPVATCFDVIKGWHENKPVDPLTGHKRPTIVNASWGYSGTRSNPLDGVHRGQAWTYADYGSSTNNTWAAVGVVPNLGLSRKINVRVASVDADVQACLDVGIIICVAAGNSYYYIDSSSGNHWNDTANFGSGQEYLFRGSSPFDDEAFIVGNVDISYTNNLEQKSESSCSGPGVNIYAPGTYIVSAGSTNNASNSSSKYATYGGGNHPNDSNYKLMKLSGTSMASPQIAGMLACIVEANPGMTPAQAKAYMIANSKSVINDDATTPVAYTVQATNNGSGAYTLSAGTDRNGSVSGDNDSISIKVGDTITINNNANSSHPIYLKTISGDTGTGNQVTTPAASGQGSYGNNGVSWTPLKPGTFYYQCSNHSSMVGTITVTSDITWDNQDSIWGGQNRMFYNKLWTDDKPFTTNNIDGNVDLG